jgi:CheY-like chemotaxis protein/HPt (histidine-containing phosphotransfer) domain-containing protein
VTNLIGNAIKFTDKGGVTVKLKLSSQGARSMLGIEIADTGIGIAQDRLGAVFEPFTQAEGSTTRRYGGTGLGLTISRRFARALGGDIEVRSELGKGSVFALALDAGALGGVRLLRPEQAMAAATHTAADEAATWLFPSARVLVVDDGEANRDLVRIVLEEAGVEVAEAENGRVAVERALAERFDVILMDMQMPVMDGFTATRMLRQQGATIPIVALTANAMKGFEREVLDAGCTGYLSKPVQIETLLEMLAGLLGAQRKAAVSGRGERGQEATDALQELHALPPLVSRLAQHPRLYRVVRKFAQQMPEKMRAIELACAMHDVETLAGLAHWLKGSAGTAGFDAFTAPAQELELAAKRPAAPETDAIVRQLRTLVERIAVPEDREPSANRELSEIKVD